MQHAASTQAALADFWALSDAERDDTVMTGIFDAHAWHYQRNPSYRHAVSARGVGPQARAADLPRLLRPTSQTFKSYIDVLGTPFPQDDPGGFLEWLTAQLSVGLPHDRVARFNSRYQSLEALLRAIERVHSDLGLELLTSSGTSGRATIIVRDQRSTDLTVESFYQAFQRYLGMKADHRAVFMMPSRTRIAMARMARFSVQRVGLTSDRVHFAIPFPAHPDQVRIRAGRTFRPGRRGLIERRVWNPAINAIQRRYVDPHATKVALAVLERAAAHGEKVLLFGSPAQVHGVALALAGVGRRLTLAQGSLLGTGGGMKEDYGFGPDEIRRDLESVFHLTGGEAVPVRDVYGMAEANWVAMQCSGGNYHVPPWVHAVTLDDDGGFQAGPRKTGLLAFFDPHGGGDLFPAFFRTADRVTLVAGREDAVCPCGDRGAYLARDSIQRVDLLGEAGCAAQV
ncbi:MAG: hypothetical protein V1912_11535 [bacterium]